MMFSPLPTNYEMALAEVKANREEIKEQRDLVRELEAELAALRSQQSEPVAWRFKNNSGDAVTIWIDYVPQEIESVERQAREAGGTIEYAYSREAAPRVPEEALRLVLWWARSRQGECDPEKLIAAADAVERAMLASAPQVQKICI